MRASGDPYLQHCVETAVLLAIIGANSTVVAAGLLHDTLDDSFMTYDHIFGSFGSRVADLVEGVCTRSFLWFLCIRHYIFQTKLHFTCLKYIYFARKWFK